MSKEIARNEIFTDDSELAKELSKMKESVRNLERT